MKIIFLISLIVFSAARAQSQSAAPPADGNAAVSIIKFYPNPATSIINFDFQKNYDRSYSFQIFSFLGKKVYEISNVTPKTVVNLGDFYRGIYIFQLCDRNGKIVDSGKFQVSK